jgi:tetratricopeptide (TPR) repeat protein
VATKNDKPGRELPLTGGALDMVMVVIAALTVALVGWWFSFDVNRVFDMPKAFALKVGGGGLLVVWLGYGLLGPGWPWKSARLFAAPALVLLAVMTVSTATSIDPWMSLQGVYERQFGLQGLVSCVGLYLVVSTTLRSRRGAVAALGVLALVGGVIGAYSVLQSYGHDPYDFFTKPHNKVYSTLGNATFAGNALALIFPISLILAVVASATAMSRERWSEAPGHPMGLAAAWLVGLLVVALLLVAPGWYAVTSGDFVEKAARQSFMKVGMGLGLIITVALALVGSWGPASMRAESAGARRWADAALAGAMIAFALMIAAGLAFTRTRGAWVGTAVAVAGGLALLPGVFRDDVALMRKMRVAGVVALALVVGGTGLVLSAAPNTLFSRTVLSIPHAFSPEKTVYGQGQGTRRYLWAESPRVLYAHQATLDRQAADRADWREKAREVSRGEETATGVGVTIRKGLVWLFGIGIETYRYAFMSHKSKKLEALDPMTNHDNPHNNYLYTLASSGLLGLAAYLWLLWRLLSTAWRKFGGTEGTRAERALAFGVVTSFFSYAVYSIAGFDSVACSVFLYFLLGAAAVLFAPAEDEPRRSPIAHLSESWRAWRKTSGSEPSPVVVAGLVVLSLLAIQTVYGVLKVNAAEQAFVGGGQARRDFEGRVAGMKRALELNPRESFYWQSLGGLYMDAARQYKDGAARAEQQGQADAAVGYRKRAQEMVAEAEKAYYAALDHAWAPENIYISLFQLYYGWQDWTGAERALERALSHSPHLGPVRANLAVLELERGAYQEALDDCLWVLDVEPSNVMALRTCGRAQFKLGALGEARKYLDRAKAVSPSDRALATFLRELEAAEAPTSTKAAAPAPG